MLQYISDTLLSHGMVSEIHIICNGTPHEIHSTIEWIATFKMCSSIRLCMILESTSKGTTDTKVIPWAQ